MLCLIRNDTTRKERSLDPRTIDKIWGRKYATEITRQVKKVAGIVEFSTNSETPLTLLDAALKKLNHEQLDLNKVKHDDETKTVKLIRDIRERVKELEGEFMKYRKMRKKIKT